MTETGSRVRPGPDAFLGALDRTAERAAAQAGGFEDHDYGIAGFGVRLRFAGHALVPRLARALAHLRTSGWAKPALTIRLWDSHSTGVAMPPPPWRVDDYREQGTIRGFFGTGIYTFFQWGANSLSVLDTDRNEGLYWVKSAKREPFPEMAAPLHSILQLWMGKRGLQVVHAGAVGTPEGCVLIVGSSGSGKSSTALACLSSELRFLADDYCLVRLDEPPTVYSLYSSGQSNGDTLERLPFLSSMVSNPSRGDSEKAIHFLHEQVPDRLLAEAPLRGVAVPRVTGRRETYVRPTSSAAALAALAPSTIFQMPGTGQPTLQRLARIVKAVPSYHLDVGTDPGQLTHALEALLAGSGAKRRPAAE